MMTLAQALTLVPQAALVGRGDVVFQRVHSDTRTLQPGDLFVALRGERFDAHAFFDEAKRKGAVAALAEHGLSESWPGLLVNNAYDALQSLAAGWPRRFDLPVVAVTGSNGKTTVTQMIASIFRAWKPLAFWATQGNLNNHIGVPLTLLGLRPHHSVAVLELGMNHPGEMARLAQWTAPTIALINNAQREHQEFLSGVLAVAEENGAVLDALPREGMAIIPAGDDHEAMWRERCGSRRVWTFGRHDNADVRVSGQWRGYAWQALIDSPRGQAAFSLKMVGDHHLQNAAAAAACALAAGAPASAVAQGLETFEAVSGRSRVLRAQWRDEQVVVIDDTYNANPDSVRAAIDVLAQWEARSWLILGDMGEVGDQGAVFHAEVGHYARDRGIGHLWCAGPLSVHAAKAFGPSARHFQQVPDLLSELTSGPSVAAILVKGSRFMTMERAVSALVTPEGVHAA